MTRRALRLTPTPHPGARSRDRRGPHAVPSGGRTPSVAAHRSGAGCTGGPPSSTARRPLHRVRTPRHPRRCIAVRQSPGLRDPLPLRDAPSVHGRQRALGAGALAVDDGRPRRCATRVPAPLVLPVARCCAPHASGREAHPMAEQGHDGALLRLTTPSGRAPSPRHSRAAATRPRSTPPRSLTTSAHSETGSRYSRRSPYWPRYGPSGRCS